MGKQLFFKPTLLYREYQILEMINNDPNITQRVISNELNIALSTVNSNLVSFEQQGLLNRIYHTSKTVEYNLTKAGLERMRVLNIGYLNDTQMLYKTAKKELKSFLHSISDRGLKRIIFYGAGEVSEIILETIKEDRTIPVEVVGVIDDSVSKQGKLITDHKISNNSIINDLEHDAILIASYTSHDQIYRKLEKVNYPQDKIVYFFK